MLVFFFNKSFENWSTNLHGEVFAGEITQAREAKRAISSCGAGREDTSRRVLTEKASCGSCSGGEV